MSGRATGWAWVIFLAVGCFASLSWAATDEEKAAARSLARQGLGAFEEGDSARAVDYFSRAEALVHSPVHLVYLARSYARLGRLVKAQEAYIRITREELPSSAPAAFQQARGDAEAELSALKPRLARLTVKVDNPGGGELTVLLDDEVVPSVLLGVAMPVDPGDHRLRADAPGAKTARQQITLTEGQTGAVELALEPLPKAAALRAETPGAADGGSAGTEGGPPYAAYGAFGLAAIGGGLATYFFLGQQSSIEKRDQLCPGLLCARADEDRVGELQQDAEDARLYGIVSAATGGAALVLGAVLLIIDDSAPETALEPALRPALGWGTVGVQGAF